MRRRFDCTRRTYGANRPSTLYYASWRDAFHLRGMLYSCPRWCGQCFDDMSAEKQPIYRPLLWSLACVKHCPKHRVRFQERCAQCGSVQPFVPSHSALDRCSKCGHFLCSRVKKNATVGIEVSAIDRFCAAEVGWLIASGGDQEHLLRLSRVGSQLRKIALLSGVPSVERLALRLGFGKTLFVRWCSAVANRPLLDLFLATCFRLGMTVRTFLEEDWTLENLPVAKERRRACTDVAPKLTPAEKELIGNCLRSHIQSDQTCPPIALLAAACGVQPGRLRRHFPELIAVLKLKRRSHLALHAAERDERLRRITTEVVKEMLASRVQYDKWELERRLQEHRLSLLNPTVRAVAHAARKGILDGLLQVRLASEGNLGPLPAA